MKSQSGQWCAVVFGTSALLATLVALPAPVLVSISLGQNGQASATRNEDDRLAAFFEEVFERRVAESPIFQSRLGRTKSGGEWDDFSDAHSEKQNTQTKRDLAQLHSDFDYDRLSTTSKLSYDVFTFDAERSLRNFEFRYHHYVATQHISQVSGLPIVLQNLHFVETSEDAEAYLSRLQKMEILMKQFVTLLRTRGERGIIAPALSFTYVIDDARAVISGAPVDFSGKENALFADFRTKVERLSVVDEVRASLLARAESALNGPVKRGYEAFIAEMERLRSQAPGNDGVWCLPDGAAYYRNRIRNHTTLDMTAEKIHEIGLREVARIQEKMKEIQEQVGFEGDLPAFFEFVRNDPNNYFADGDEGREQFLAAARAQIDEINPALGGYFNRLPQAPIEVRRVEPWRENSGGIAFYNRPSADGSRPGIYYANLRDMSQVQKYVFTAITYHESIPGHHLQNTVAQEAVALPTFRKYGSYGAYGEGWALYAEQLAKEMGFYKDPMRDLGRLQNELWRAVRLVVDTGLHAKRWTRQEAIQYFRDNTPLSEGDIKTEVERYLVVPGQALSYKMGMLKILELRAKARKILADRFDIREFHDAVLGNGALPLPILEQVVNAYISRERAP